MNQDQIKTKTGISTRFFLGLTLSILALSSCGGQANKARMSSSATATLVTSDTGGMTTYTPEKTLSEPKDQLVYFQARLRNLQKSEQIISKIMERSGSVEEAMKADQQLSTIRESIERIDAQLINLQNQVAASTPNNWGLRIQETWGTATHKMAEFTWLLVGLMLWLLAFSPYLLIIGGAAYGYHWYRQHQIK